MSGSHDLSDVAAAINTAAAIEEALASGEIVDTSAEAAECPKPTAPRATCKSSPADQFKNVHHTNLGHTTPVRCKGFLGGQCTHCHPVTLQRWGIYPLSKYIFVLFQLEIAKAISSEVMKKVDRLRSRRPHRADQNHRKKKTNSHHQA